MTQETITLITQFGFPIVACMCIAIWASKLVSRVQADGKEREDKLMGVITSLTGALEKLSKEIPEIRETINEIQREISRKGDR